MSDLTWTEPAFWAAAVACLIAQVAIVRSVLAARAHRPLARRPMELTWAVTPALALLGVLALTWRAV